MASEERSQQSPGLAEGEDPSTTSVREARRWISVYSELLKIEGEVLESVRSKLARMSEEAREITEQTNLPSLERDAEHFRARLAFWRERLSQLERSR
jgi:FtsZ-binding cell division protein ZapB